MSAPPAAEEGAAAKPKSKKLLIIILAAVLLLGGGGGALFFIMRQRAAAANADDPAHAPAAAAPAAAAHPDPKNPPTFLPLDNIVINLADPGGDRMAQIGVTVEVVDAKTAELVKQHMPVIRNGVLLAISRRTSQELLQAEGKEKLARDILQEISTPLGYEVESPEDEAAAKNNKKKNVRRAPPNPILKILFSSFIIQ